MTRLTSVAVVTCTAAFVAGMVLALFGSLKLKLAERLRIGEARVGGLLAALHLAIIPMMLCGGLLIDTLGVRLVLFVGSLLLALAVFGLALRTTYAAALASVVAAGAGVACLSTASVVLMPVAFGFGPRELAASVNLGHVFVALGALMTPALVDLLLRSVDFRRALGLIALACLVPGLAAAFAGSLDLRGQQTDLADVLGDVRIWMIGIALLLYAPLEFAISTWGTSYLTTDQGYGERRAARVLSGFWLAFLGSRMLVTAALHLGYLRESWAPPMVMLLALGAAMALGHLAGGARHGPATALVGLGFALGPIFPTLVALALEHFPDMRGTAYGAVYAVGSLGSLILMPVIGFAVRGRKVMRGLGLLAPMAMLLVVAALAIWLG